MFARGFKEKRRGKLTKSVFILHDNAPVYNAHVAVSAMTACGFKEPNDPPCSPDLAPSDISPFPNLFLGHFTPILRIKNAFRKRPRVISIFFFFFNNVIFFT